MKADQWYLEGYFSGDSVLGRLPVNRSPFTVGRESQMDFAVPSSEVSRFHAELRLENGFLMLRDNRSTNGTFINRRELRGDNQAVLRHGDIVHFANFEVRIICESVHKTSDPTISRTAFRLEDLPQKMAAGARELQELIDAKLVTSVYQPIIQSADESVFAYEVLGRGTHQALSPSPGPLFHIAESLHGLTVPLSCLFREVGVARAAGFGADTRYFLNLHPHELDDPDALLLHLQLLREQYRDLQLVLEIHEKAVSNIQVMKRICQGLRELSIELAYDDFGVGQTRFIELIEAPSDYLKFDIELVGNISDATDAKQNMVRQLVGMARDMGIRTLAEGLERAEDARVCREIGFDYLQGYHYGKPAPELV